MKSKLGIRIITVVLAVCMICVLGSACDKKTDVENEVTTEKTTDSTQEEVTQEATQEVMDEKTVEILMALPIFGAPNTNSLPSVQDAINEVAVEKANVKVKIEPISFGSYAQQMILMLSGDETLDLMMLTKNELSTYANRSQIIGLNDLLDEYGKGIKEQLGDYINATSLSGEVYALATIRAFCRGGGFNVRDDLIEKYNIDTSAVNTLEDMTPIFATIKEGEGEGFWPLVVSTGGTSFLDTIILFDQMGDNNGVLIDRGVTNTEVVLGEATQQYKDAITLFHDWYEAGYIQSDIVTSQESYHTMIKSGMGFSYMTNSKPGIEETAKRNTGYEMTNIKVLDYSATTDDVISINWAIAQTSENPEASMKFLNLMWTDADVETILTWGVEGENYVINDEGFATYPEGVTADTNGWSLNASWLMGNQFLTPHWEGEQADLWDLQKAANDSATKSLALGFTFNNENVKTEAAAVDAVRSEYKMSVENGVGDPETMLPEYIQRLKDAGIEKIIAEKQAQLDAWLANR